MGIELSKLKFPNKKKVTEQWDSSKRWLLFHGGHETHRSEGAEGELHTRNAVCEKNPGHIEFIPVYRFTLENLPEGHRDNDVYELIKTTADLTVKVNVKMTSPRRPEFWPKTNKPYPFHKDKEVALRTGTGRMSYVSKLTNGVDRYGTTQRKKYGKCWCKKCQQSRSPSNVWWEFNVETATHVVFDDIEASHTTLRLFYDTLDSPLIIVDKVKAVNTVVRDDWCRLKCVTCDQSLGNTLERMWNLYEHFWWKVWGNYKNSRDAEKFMFIVSHPHGCTKQISLGQWTEKCKVDKSSSKFTYTTCTCPGSSGASIYCVGYSVPWWWGWYQLVHSGSVAARLNYSGAGQFY